MMSGRRVMGPLMENWLMASQSPAAGLGEVGEPHIVATVSPPLLVLDFHPAHQQAMEGAVWPLTGRGVEIEHLTHCVLTGACGGTLGLSRCTASRSTSSSTTWRKSLRQGLDESNHVVATDSAIAHPASHPHHLLF